ncbi:MAG: hypothetical protein ACTS9Y_01340 [Methylophilus sp.]|uniref:hypothetical protein n=1 Tax=Methylophilus sp. TaxID=29541 RepID=UPI003F9ECEF9
MKFLNPFIKIHDGLTARWSEISVDKNRYLEIVWNKGETISCLCHGIKQPITMSVGKRGDDFYIKNRDGSEHKEQCPCGHMGKKGEFYKKTSLGNMQKLLELTLVDMGMNVWSPNFERVRNKFLFRKKFMESFQEGLLFFPEYGEDKKEQNLIVINSLPPLCGGEFYVAGFIFEYHLEENQRGSFVKLTGFDKKFFIDEDIGNLLRQKDRNFDFFCLFKVMVLNSGKYVAVDASGIYVHKKTLTPHYKKSTDINAGRLFKSNLYHAKPSKEVV